MSAVQEETAAPDHPIVQKLVRRLGTKKGPPALSKEAFAELSAEIEALDNGLDATRLARRLLVISCFLDEQKKAPEAGDAVARLAELAAKRGSELLKTWHKTAERSLDARARFASFEDRHLRAAVDDADAAYRRGKPLLKTNLVSPRVRV